MPSDVIETDSHTLVTIPCLSDNYAFLLRENASGAVALIDVPEAAPIRAELDARGWALSQIWITHHHPDHVQGLAELAQSHAAPVYGARADAARLPDLDHPLAEGDTFTLGSTAVEVIDVSGHTIGHIAFHAPGAGMAFTADSLMALGCGRLFEGTPAQMWESLSKMADWPDDTLICSGHEYTQSNARFALTVDPDNAALRDRAAAVDAARADGRFTVPSTLAEERATNPFLRPGDAGIRAALGMAEATDAEVFAEIRGRKDRF
ncbi:hydroxyacylglutathione hydrolase [Sulfitobacter albidus]|uniref:Hydroxyacylglutathione hydrolase n=1 Tax=Sulfitobacter albidus TaxID=2829501 RepID=A0A975PLB4_9RHOB|nr:hydroxyacylglutathione hydrolase [Sulfitobacter albidus]QUJ75543.1 hydroxyacylglutathione hydrolase [Sulfitobacter albidus]